MDHANPMQDYKAAVALNNMGVTLLERRSFKDAMETFKDAIFVMRTCFRQHADKPNDSANPSIGSRVDRAAKRMANPKPVSLPICMNVVFHDGQSYQQPPDSILRDRPSTTAVAFPIRIDCHNISAIGERDLDLESAIMLYNFGLAHSCMAKLAKSQQNSTMLLHGALKLHKMANSIISNQTAFERLSEEEAESAFQCRMCTAVLFLKAVAQVQNELGMSPEATHTYEKLVYLVNNVITDMDTDESSVALRATVAAAAA